MRCPGPGEPAPGPGPRFPPEARRRPTTAPRAPADSHLRKTTPAIATTALPCATDEDQPGIFIPLAGSGVEAEDDLRGAGGLLLPFDLDVGGDEPFHRVGDLAGVLQADRQPVALSLLEGRGEADLVQAVVDDQLEPLHLDQFEEEAGDEREREVAVRDGRAEGRLPLRALAV